MPVAIIAAVSKNGCIGRDGKLPWRIPEDMQRFKAVTMGMTVVMGRKTWESLPEKFRPLPGRKNVVVTRQAGYSVPPGVETFGSLTQALDAHKDEQVIVIGGAEIYHQAMPLADTLLITRVDQEVQGDAFFPDIDPNVWHETNREDHSGFSFVDYGRTAKRNYE